MYNKEGKGSGCEEGGRVNESYSKEKSAFCNFKNNGKLIIGFKHCSDTRLYI